MSKTYEDKDQNKKDGEEKMTERRMGGAEKGGKECKRTCVKNGKTPGYRLQSQFI